MSDATDRPADAPAPRRRGRPLGASPPLVHLPRVRVPAAALAELQARAAASGLGWSAWVRQQLGIPEKPE